MYIQNKCFRETLSTHFFFYYKLAKVCDLSGARRRTACFDTSCLGQKYTQMFTNTKEKLLMHLLTDERKLKK